MTNREYTAGPGRAEIPLNKGMSEGQGIKMFHIIKLILPVFIDMTLNL